MALVGAALWRWIISHASVYQAFAVTTRVRIWLAAAIALGVGLCFVPLFGVLGYELALASSGFAALLGLDVGASRARAAQLTPAVGPRSCGQFALAVLTSSGLAIAMACVPAVIAAIHGVWAPTCDWSFGIRAYALMPLSSAALGGALGHSLATVIGTRPQTGPWWLPHRSTWLGVALPIALLAAVGAWRFYSEPPVFIYNPIVGYFPGNLYDEDIALGMPVVWSRLEALAVVAAIVAAIAGHFDAASQRTRWKRDAWRRALPWHVASATAAFAAIALHANAGRLAYAIDAADIQAELGGKLDTEHFSIYYANTPEIAAEIQVIARDHEFRYAQVVTQIGASPRGKLTSYYFATPAQKARLVGAKNVEMAKPWRREIYLDHRPFPHPSLRHEIAHAIASAFGDPVFGVATQHLVLLNPGLIEGLAVALDWPGGSDRLSPHEAVRAMQHLGVEPHIADVFSIQFLAVAPARGYTTAGSFLRFLLERYGALNLRRLYRSGGDFAAAYQRSRAELEAEWRTMIASIELPAETVEGVRERFRTGSVFARPCPHAVAKKRNAALAARAAGDRNRAIALMRSVCNDAPEEPRHRLELGDVLANDSGPHPLEARAIWSALAENRNVSPTLRAEALRRLAHVTAEPNAKLELIERARALPLDPNDRRIFDAQAIALRSTGPAGPYLREYFQHLNPSANLLQLASQAVAQEPTSALALYLLGLQQANAGDWTAAATNLDQALTSGLPDENFKRFAARRLAIAAYRAGDAARLDRAIAAMLGPQTTVVDHLLADDWKQRRTFDATRHL